MFFSWLGLEGELDMGFFIEIGSVHKLFAEYILFKTRLDQTIHPCCTALSSALAYLNKSENLINFCGETNVILRGTGFKPCPSPNVC